MFSHILNFIISSYLTIIILHYFKIVNTIMKIHDCVRHVKITVPIAALLIKRANRNDWGHDNKSIVVSKFSSVIGIIVNSHVISAASSVASLPQLHHFWCDSTFAVSSHVILRHLWCRDIFDVTPLVQLRLKFWSVPCALTQHLLLRNIFCLFTSNIMSLTLTHHSCCYINCFVTSLVPLRH